MKENLRLKLLLSPTMIIIKLHPRLSRHLTRTSPKTRHPTPINIECANGEEVEEQTVCNGAFGGVGEMLGEVALGGYGVSGWRVELGEAGMRVCAVQTFLEAVDPVEVVRLFSTV